jgi:hypothetical protein
MCTNSLGKGKKQPEREKKEEKKSSNHRTPREGRSLFWRAAKITHGGCGVEHHDANKNVPSQEVAKYPTFATLAVVCVTYPHVRIGQFLFQLGVISILVPLISKQVHFPLNFPDAVGDRFPTICICLLQLRNENAPV